MISPLTAIYSLVCAKDTWTQLTKATSRTLRAPGFMYAEAKAIKESSDFMEREIEELLKNPIKLNDIA